MRKKQDIPIQYFENISTLLLDKNEKMVLEVVIELRKMIKKETIEKVIEAKCIPKLIKILDSNVTKEIKCQVIWCLAMIAAGTYEQTQAVVDMGAFPILICFIEYEKDETFLLSVIWALGNIISNSVQNRDYFLDQGGLNHLLKISNEKCSISLKRNLSWVVSILTNFEIFPDIKYFPSLIPIYQKFIKIKDEDLILNTLRSILDFIDGPDFRIQIVIDAGILKNITPFIYSENIQILQTTLTIFGNIIGPNNYTKIILGYGILAPLKKLLSDKCKNKRIEAGWTLSRITACTTEHLQSVINLDIFPEIFTIFKYDDIEVKKEALWVMCNSFDYGTLKQIEYILNFGTIDLLLTKYENDELTFTCLERLKNIFNVTLHNNNIVYDKIKKEFDLKDGRTYLRSLLPKHREIVLDILDIIMDLTEDDMDLKKELKK